MKGRGASQRPIRAAMSALALLLVVGACGGTDTNDDTDRGVQIVATTSILGDIAGNVVGDAGTVHVLIPLGADPHEYDASSQQVARIHTADLVVANGLGLEGSLIDVLESAKTDGANVVFVGSEVDPLPFHGQAGASGELDPHIWLDLQRVARVGVLIAEELAAITPDIDWADNAATYAQRLADADAEVAQILAAVPQARRKLVTNHNSLGYLATRYGYEIIGSVLPGGATLTDPSSADLAALIDTVSRENVVAIFVETTEPDALARAVAQDVEGSVEIVELYTGSLGDEGSGADTVIGLALTNARRIAGAL